MSLWKGLSERVTIELTSGDLSQCLDQLTRAQIPLEDLNVLDELTVQFCIPREDLGRVKELTRRRGDQIRVLSHRGWITGAKKLLRRPVLTFGVLGLLMFTLWVPTRIFFVEVEGNTTVSARQILEAAAQCGISFGASRQQVRSEEMKNALLANLPSLQWAGVNTYGCRAVITVRERNAQVTREETYPVSSIVAVCDGIVRQITVEKGTALCIPGQAVKAGDILISGYTDLGICTRVGQSVGEIYADTQRKIRAVLPTEYLQRGKMTATRKKYSIILGKKRWNLGKGSGISGGSCAKIYTEVYLTLPGGFQLPIALCCEQWYDYDTQTITEEDPDILSEYAAHYLSRQMVAGTIRRQTLVYFRQEGYCLLEGIYDCYEMIGLTQPEERANE